MPKDREGERTQIALHLEKRPVSSRDANIKVGCSGLTGASGFIQRENGEDVFVHFSAIQAGGYRTLEEGARVSFIVKKGPKGLQAEEVNLA